MLVVHLLVRAAAAQAPDGAQLLVPGCVCDAGWFVTGPAAPSSGWWALTLDSNQLRIEAVSVEEVKAPPGGPRPAACDRPRPPQPGGSPADGVARTDGP